jgi:hypothetical protein
VLNIINLAIIGGHGTPSARARCFLFFCLGSHAVLGAVDDWQGIKGHPRRGEGMSPRMKSAFQFALCHFHRAGALFWPAAVGLRGRARLPDFFRIGPLIIPATIFLLV